MLPCSCPPPCPALFISFPRPYWWPCSVQGWRGWTGWHQPGAGDSWACYLRADVRSLALAQTDSAFCLLWVSPALHTSCLEDAESKGRFSQCLKRWLEASCSDHHGRRPQPLFTPHPFPHRWSHGLVSPPRWLAEFLGTVLQLTVQTESSPRTENSKSWLWFA